MSTTPDHGGLWPTRQELVKLMDEQTMDELQTLAHGRGVRGLCARLGTDPDRGLPRALLDRVARTEAFGENTFEDRRLTPYCSYVWQQLQEKIILLLLFMATLEIFVKGIGGRGLERTEAFAEASVLYITVAIIVNVAAYLDWKRERMFDELTKRLALSNLRFIVRDGVQLEVTDVDICVGDIVSFNAHMASIISCDGLLLSGEDVRCDESALTGEPEPIEKSPERPFMISGTTVNSGSGTFLVVAVGEHCIAGKIKKEVYGDTENMSPLYQKLHDMVGTISKVGVSAAVISFTASLVYTYGVHRSTEASKVIDIVMQALGILACAIPEGLPLALVIALALTSNKMSTENNLVKTLNSCETMGSATTICTDKTGTLTTNRMTVRAAYIGGRMFDPHLSDPVGPRIREDGVVGDRCKELLGSLTCVCTMDESGFLYKDNLVQFQGNPTECALLKMAEELGYDYAKVRASTRGRSKETLHDGFSNAFTSARKMMSWCVAKPGGGYRVYTKGASEIVLQRATHVLESDRVVELDPAEAQRLTDDAIGRFADMAMRTIGLAYKDIDEMESNHQGRRSSVHGEAQAEPEAAPGRGIGGERPRNEMHPTVLNADGSPAFACETDLVLLGIVGIEDPLRPEVAPAIQLCYRAGIDIRMVTGDNLNTAVAIAKRAGILNESLHYGKDGVLLPNRALEGKVFRKMVHDLDITGEATFNQAKFDEFWPYLRVLARSSPGDKLTLAKGLNASLLFRDKEKCRRLQVDECIHIFPDRQVVAMTGDGTNDAQALKNADVGFAMGIAGTQIAKDAANIILLDDNFASIVVAAKWGRNVFASIQKFLQFQLTVNAAILALNVYCALSDIKCPLTVLHLLWLNLIMDSAASIALASEPPTNCLLERPPVNRNDFIVTRQMLTNILGMASYQVGLTIGLLHHYTWIPDLKVHADDPITLGRSRHYTMLFNIFVLLQVFNEYNARFLRGEWQIWRGLDKNRLYLLISVGTMTFQILMVQVAAPILTHALKIHPAGLSWRQWLLCLGFGLSTLVVQQVLNGLRNLTLLCLRGRRREARPDAVPVGPPKTGEEPEPLEREDAKLDFDDLPEVEVSTRAGAIGVEAEASLPRLLGTPAKPLPCLCTEV